MPRAQFRDTIFVRALGDTLSTPPSQLLAALYDVGTSSPINEAIYVDDQTSTMLPNPIPVANDGILIFWLAEERQLDIVTFCPGYTDVRSTVLTDSTGTPTQGANGPPGDTGAIGPAGAPGTSIVWLGAWSPTTGYVVNNAVSYDGSSYLCVAPLTGGSGPATDPMHWALMAAAGESDIPGATGARGSLWFEGNGPPGTIPGVLPHDQYLDTTTGDVYVFS